MSICSNNSQNIACNISLLISGFAAIVSMIALVWNIINSIISRKAKLLIDFSINQQMIAQPGVGISNPIPVFSVNVVNVGMNTRYINNPTFVFEKK